MLNVSGQWIGIIMNTLRGNIYPLYAKDYEFLEKKPD